jgi:hypothetical protein
VNLYDLFGSIITDVIVILKYNVYRDGKKFWIFFLNFFFFFQKKNRKNKNKKQKIKNKKQKTNKEIVAKVTRLSIEERVCVDTPLISIDVVPYYAWTTSKG